MQIRSNRNIALTIIAVTAVFFYFLYSAMEFKNDVRIFNINYGFYLDLIWFTALLLVFDIDKMKESLSNAAIAFLACSLAFLIFYPF